VAVYVAVDDDGHPIPVKSSVAATSPASACKCGSSCHHHTGKSATPKGTRKKVAEFTLESPKCPAIRIGMMPKDTSVSGSNIFAGVILSHMDTAGVIATRDVTTNRVVTVSFDKVVFKQPVHVGDVLTCWSEVIKVGRTSITTRIVVAAQRKGVFIPVTEGEAVYVSVDPQGKPTPVKPDGTTTPVPGASNCGPTCSSTASAPTKTKTKTKSKNKKKQKRKSKKNSKKKGAK
jgi:acyl-CoA thioesterase YciA